MGQSSSKHQDASLSSECPGSTSHNSVAGASTDLHPDSACDLEDESSSSQPGSPRSSPSIRKSIFNFVKPSNIRSRVSSIASHPPDSRRSWRNPILRPKDSLPTSSSSASSTAGPSTASLSPTDKGKKPERNDSDDDDDVEDLSTPVDLDFPIEQPSSPILPPSSEILEDDVQTIPEIVVSSESPAPVVVVASPEDDETNTLYVSDPGEPEEQQQPPVYHQEDPEHVVPQPSSPPPPTRQFPPPGTLVVVQGIVHTTDVSRNNTPGTESNSSSTSTLRPVPDPTTESGTTRARNRLSALLRPRSSSHSPSTINHPIPLVTITPPADSDSPLSSSVEPEVLETSPHSLSNEPADTVAEPLQDGSLLLTNHHHHSPSISSSSIDVLGTLLSVAAAATAASLLTGSSEPILSSGLAPPNPSTPAPPPINDNNVLPVPVIPPPVPATTPLADISAAGRAERMRHAWSTIRERLGLRPSAAPPSEQDIRNDVPVAPTTTTTADPATPISLPDTRELMLAEMTRAFNVGFGLGAHGAGGNSNQVQGESGVTPDMNNTNNNQESSDSETPPEGSFDRFLMDLQRDLRTALTQAEDLPRTSTPQATPSEPVQQPQEPEAGTENTNAVSDQHEDHRAQPQGIHLANVDSERSSIEVYDTDSEFGEAEEDSDDDDFHSARLASNPVINNSPRSPTLGPGRIDASGRINWWRLYRFPPVMPPRLDMGNLRQGFVPGAAAAASPTTTPSVLPISSMASSMAVPEGLGFNPTLPSTTADPPLSPSPDTASIRPPQAQTQEPPTPQAVVPVIVVGLQSVNSDWRADMPPPDENDMEFNHHHDGVGVGGGEVGGGGGGGPEISDDEEFDGYSNMQPELGSDDIPDTGAGRGRGLGAGHRGRTGGWQTRAANAIRNLRPGRRPTPAETQHSVSIPGSRTFLIYVIGGYYPPDHSIVTGGPNNLDSFEALLELADLLGQVKPPTVSKDEIEKSGLEIIKAAELSQHENNGKVSSNCLDRCLICLDDYEPEEDIRVMTCRHAFHQTCVDEWLQTGRNNCPACRTTGVTTGVGGFTTPRV